MRPVAVPVLARRQMSIHAECWLEIWIFENENYQQFDTCQIAKN